MRLLKRLLKLLDLGEHAEFIWKILELFGLTKLINLVFYSIAAVFGGYFAIISDWPPIGIFLATIAAGVGLSVVYAAIRYARSKQGASYTSGKPEFRQEREFEPDITARDAFFQTLDDSAWKEEQLRTTTDTRSLARNWLEVRLRVEIHKALRNSRLASWGEECLQGTVTTPEKPIPPETWDRVEILFDRAPQIPKTAAFFKGHVSFERGPMAWVGVKFSREQYSALFPPASTRSIDRIPCTQLLKMAEEQGWDFSSRTSLQLLDLQTAMRQGGLDDTLAIWGRRKHWDSDSLMRNEPLQRIGADHWKDHFVHLIAVLEGNNFETYSWLSRGHVGRRGYIDLHVQRSQAEDWLRRSAASFRGTTRATQ